MFRKRRQDNCGHDTVAEVASSGNVSLWQQTAPSSLLCFMNQMVDLGVLRRRRVEPEQGKRKVFVDLPSRGRPVCHGGSASQRGFDWNAELFGIFHVHL